MRIPKLSKMAKTALTCIAVGVALAAFAAGLFVSARTPALVADPDEVVRTAVPSEIGKPNPDGTWTWTKVPAPPSGQTDDYDPVMEPDASGVATMGKLLHLFDGGSVQLPPDVYVEKLIDLGACMNSPDCPVYPVVYWLGETIGQR